MRFYCSATTAISAENNQNWTKLDLQSITKNKTLHPQFYSEVKHCWMIAWIMIHNISYQINNVFGILIYSFFWISYSFSFTFISISKTRFFDNLKNIHLMLERTWIHPKVSLDSVFDYIPWSASGGEESEVVEQCHVFYLSSYDDI